MNKCRIATVTLAVAYLISYGALRTRNAEAWSVDGKVYVHYPQASPWLYYLFRPISYLEVAVTGMRFHIGPHQGAGPAR